MSKKVPITRQEKLEKALEDYRKNPEMLPDLLILLVHQVNNLNYLVQPFVDMAWKDYLNQQSMAKKAKDVLRNIEISNEKINRCLKKNGGKP